MRVLSCWRVLWFMAWMISCICCCDSGAVLICWRRSSALWPAGGREGAQGCPDGWQIVPCPTLCHFGKRVQFVAKSSVSPILLPQQTTAKRNSLTTTDWEKISNIWLHTLKLPQKVESAQPLLNHSLCVSNPVDVDTQKRTSADDLCERAKTVIIKWLKKCKILKGRFHCRVSKNQN